MAPRSRYLHLAWAKWELEQCNMANACKLLERGHQLNPQDGALLQVPPRFPCAAVLTPPTHTANQPSSYAKAFGPPRLQLRCMYPHCTAHFVLDAPPALTWSHGWQPSVWQWQ